MTLILKSGARVKAPRDLRENLSKEYVLWLKDSSKNITCSTGERNGIIYFFVWYSEISAIV